MQDKQRGRHKLKIQDSKSGIVLLKRKTNYEDRKKQLMNYKTKGPMPREIGKTQIIRKRICKH